MYWNMRLDLHGSAFEDLKSGLEGWRIDLGENNQQVTIIIHQKVCLRTLSANLFEAQFQLEVKT